MILNLEEEFLSKLISPLVALKHHWANDPSFKMLIKKSINRFRLFHSTIVFAKSFLQSTTSLPNILHVTVFGLSS